MKPAHLNSSQGNRCGHDPRQLRIGLDRLGQEDGPEDLHLTAELAARWFRQPQNSPIFRGAGRQVRSERREACLAVLSVLLRHLDTSSLRVGLSTPGDGFIGLGLKTLARESGLGTRRCERALARLKAAGLVASAEPSLSGHFPSPKHASLRVVWVLSPDLLISLVLEHNRLVLNLLGADAGGQP